LSSSSSVSDGDPELFSAMVVRLLDDVEQTPETQPVDSDML